MRNKGIDYFANSRCSPHVQRQNAIANPLGFDGYNAPAFALTDSPV